MFFFEKKQNNCENALCYQLRSKLSDCFAELPILSWHIKISTPLTSPFQGDFVQVRKMILMP